MIRYTARHGTTFRFDPEGHELRVVGAEADSDGEASGVDLDLEDLREFLQHLDDRAEAVSEEDAPSDADAAAIGPD